MAGQSQNTSCLHLVATSRAEAIARCADLFSEGDSVVFLDEGVMHSAVCGAPAHPLSEQGNFLQADLAARGLPASAADQAWKVITDSDFVGLLKRYPHCLTWK